jgi:hypothetical protein
VGRGKMGTTTPKQASTTTRVISPILPIRRALGGNPADIERCYPALGGVCKRSIHEADIEDKYTRHSPHETRGLARLRYQPGARPRSSRRVDRAAPFGAERGYLQLWPVD